MLCRVWRERRKRSRCRGLVSLYFIEWNETPGGGLIKGYLGGNLGKFERKKKETRVSFVWRYIRDKFASWFLIMDFFFQFSSVFSCLEIRRKWEGKNFVRRFYIRHEGRSLMRGIILSQEFNSFLLEIFNDYMHNNKIIELLHLYFI